MAKLKSTLGYTGAGATVLLAAIAPFLLYPAFHKGFTRMGLHVDEVYSGGPKVRTIQSGAYSIDIHRSVTPHFFQTEKPFVQLDWKPVAALPPHISDVIDIDGDGAADVRVDFDVPKDAKAPLHVDVDSLNPRYESMKGIGKPKFSSLIVRVDDAVIVRVPKK